MSNKLILIGIAIAAVGLVALPQTLALFAGQHNFYDNIGTGAAAIPCEKCHADVFSELSQPGSVNTVHMGQGCEGCHVTTAPNKEGLTQGGNSGADFHAAALPLCLDCHSGTGPGKDARSILDGSVEAHTAFANQANDSLLLRGSNEACISCHTHVAVDINWTKAYKISFNAMENATTGLHEWTVDNFATEGTVQIQTYGNRSGGINSATEPVVSISPEPLGFDPSNP
ncbi:MAG: hypothetical protein WA144_09220 [Candidatus Methanoperedens sp.]